MSLKEELNEKKAALAALKERIDADDAEAIAQGEQLLTEISEKEKEIETAEKKAELIKNIGMKGNENMENIKEINLEELKTSKGSKSFALKAYNDTEKMGDNKILDYDRNPVLAVPELGVRDLFNSESISGNALTFYKVGAAVGNSAPFATTAEDAQKPQFNVPYTPVTVALTKIAGFMKESDELLSDAPFLESAIRNRGIYDFNKAVEAYLIGALSGTSDVISGQSSISFDNILKAKQEIRKQTGYAADAIVINPADLETLLIAKDGGSSGQYLLGGPAYGPYGNGSYNGNPRIWGLTVVESAACPEGQCIVGAFKAGASVVTKAGEGLRVEVSNSDQNDFIYNRITVRIEERLVLAARVPAAFCLVGTASSSSN